jgi:hypothetical protein
MIILIKGFPIPRDERAKDWWNWRGWPCSSLLLFMYFLHDIFPSEILEKIPVKDFKEIFGSHQFHKPIMMKNFSQY